MRCSCGPQLTKSLLSVRKLTEDNEVDILFSNPSFIIQNHHSKETLSQGRRKHGLYVLEHGQQAVLAKLSSRRLQTSFEICHNRLGHVSYEVIYVLNKTGCLSSTSLSPKSHTCSSCHLSKSKCLSFDLSVKVLYMC